jgi:hypothetical protein
MKNLLSILIISILSFSLTFHGCSKNSPEPEPVIKSSVSVTGDVSEAYDVIAYFGISTFSSDMEEKEYFSILLFPVAAENPLAMTLFYKSGASVAEAGKYPIGKYAFGDEIPVDIFGGSFSAQNADDFSGYIMTSGELTISKSSSALIAGNFGMSGHHVQFVDEDTSRVVTISGKFNAIPIPEMIKN